ALHTALRQNDPQPLIIEGVNLREEILHARQQMATICEKLHTGNWLGATGEPIKDLVHIGIGGSHLGPECVLTALSHPKERKPRVHFVSTVDGEQLQQTLNQLDPNRTLIVLASKSFGTQETLVNGTHAKNWLQRSLPAESGIANHLIAVTANKQAALDFGIPEEQILSFWSWVGGRYSVWSAVGLPIAAALGYGTFEQFLTGAARMDQHFRTAPLDSNMPVLMALIGIWYIDFFGARSHAILPYDWRLRLFPEAIQQCDMESNGKSVSSDGLSLPYATGPVIWGKSAIDAQHAFYQHLHQGNPWTPCDLIACAQPVFPEHNHDILFANFVAQSRALMLGRNSEQVARDLAKHTVSDAQRRLLISAKVCPGNRPSNSLLLSTLSAETVGMLLALYEHKIFVQGHIWGINSFDQMGVELGKEIAHEVSAQLKHAEPGKQLDSSSHGLISKYLENTRKS
ncbi:MAG TPA: glucose-6-phosphate isomerase, partial [Gammaproteobacteria bacterium]|nr:glucose-6-phosphate isomerase [Gammaproteobacteria bacterium]